MMSLIKWPPANLIALNPTNKIDCCDASSFDPSNAKYIDPLKLSNVWNKIFIYYSYWIKIQCTKLQILAQTSMHINNLNLHVHNKYIYLGF